jgi:uncharacterized membrane protein
VNARRAAPLLAAAAIRLLAIAASDREVADVERYRKVADHVLDVSWNPYQAPRLYPYPPVWVWVEAGAGWLARQAPVSFPLLIKLPTLAADLFIVAFLMRRTRAGAWIYALHPVAILVGAFHGQFDAIALALVLAALAALEADRADRAALLLAGAIGLKSFPVLLLPYFILRRPTAAARLRFAALALGPVAAVLVPYALHDFAAVRRELLGYGGVADFGWIGLWRGLRWLATGELARSSAAHWPAAVAAGKWLFLAAYVALFAWLARRRVEPSRAALLTLLLFLTVYGALSAQYLLWVVPLAALWPDRWTIAHAVASTLALVGFYVFLAPGVLAPPTFAVPRQAAGVLWVIGTAAVLATGLAWLAARIAAPRRLPAGAARAV